MTTTTIPTILYSMLWLAIGVAAAYAFIWSIRKTADLASPEAKTRSLALIGLGAFLRLALMGVVMYVALKMRVLYVLLFVLSFTIAHFLLLFRMRKSAADKVKSTEEHDA